MDSAVLVHLVDLRYSFPGQGCKQYNNNNNNNNNEKLVYIAPQNADANSAAHAFQQPSNLIHMRLTSSDLRLHRYITQIYIYIQIYLLSA